MIDIKTNSLETVTDCPCRQQSQPKSLLNTYKINKVAFRTIMFTFHNNGCGRINGPLSILLISPSCLIRLHQSSFKILTIESSRDPFTSLICLTLSGWVGTDCVLTERSYSLTIRNSCGCIIIYLLKWCIPNVIFVIKHDFSSIFVLHQPITLSFWFSLFFMSSLLCHTYVSIMSRKRILNDIIICT